MSEWHQRERGTIDAATLSAQIGEALAPLASAEVGARCARKIFEGTLIPHFHAGVCLQVPEERVDTLEVWRAEAIGIYMCTM